MSSIRRQHRPVPRRARGSILVIVLLTLTFATTALLLFMERASTDLIVHVRDADRLRLRQEAYSALETTLAVLVDFKEVLGGLHSPAEGWQDPLEWAGYEPGEGREVKVEFEDESGKLSVARLNFQNLFDLFSSWDEPEHDAKLWADALIGWMEEDYTPETFDAPRPEDYERAPLAFVPPGRPLLSFAELQAIDVIREAFFDENGYPNDRGRRFIAAVSLLNFRSINANSAPGWLLGAVGRLDERQQDLIDDYRAGAGMYQGNGPGYFTSTDEMKAILGEQAGTAEFGTEIAALRIRVTVTQGPSVYRLSVVISPDGSASLVRSDPIPQKDEESDETTADDEASSSQSDAGDESATSASSTDKPQSAAARAVAENAESDQMSLEYPFTLLEIREIDASEPAAEIPQLTRL